MLGFKSFQTAVSILSGVEGTNMIKKEQIDLRDQSGQNQNIFINLICTRTLNENFSKHNKAAS